MEIDPIAVLVGGLNPFSFSLAPAAWLTVIYMGIPCTALAVSLYLKGLSAVSTYESGLLLLLEIVTGLVLAASLLGELPSRLELADAVLIVSGLGAGVFLRRN